MSINKLRKHCWGARDAERMIPLNILHGNSPLSTDKLMKYQQSLAVTGPQWPDFLGIIMVNKILQFSKHKK